MMTPSTIALANNILEKSFKEPRRYRVNSMKLTKILYLTAAEYAYFTQEKLFTEDFLCYDNGPTLYSIFDMCVPLRDKPIVHYFRYMNGEALLIDTDKDAVLAGVIETIWTATKSLTAKDVAELTCLPDSAWDKAYQQNSPRLAWEDIMHDTTYREPLGLTRRY